MGRLSLGDWLEAYVCFILTVEFIYDYIWNSREARNKRRKNEKAKKGKSVEPSPLPSSGDKKDVAVVARTETSPKEGASSPSLVEMCIVCQRVHENPICFQERS